MWTSTTQRLSRPNPSWPTAATKIPDAVDAAGIGDSVLVTNGLYLLGSEIMAASDISIESVNGFTVANGYSGDMGGGLMYGDAFNCTFINNNVCFQIRLCRFPILGNHAGKNSGLRWIWKKNRDGSGMECFAGAVEFFEQRNFQRLACNEARNLLLPGESAP